jgi:hypothetical protein
MRVRAISKTTLLCIAVAACGREEQQPAMEQITADTTPVAAQPPPLSDSQALAVLMALSAAGSAAATDTLELIVIPEVRRYLRVVRADHTALQAELQVIADSLQLAPEPHEAAERLRAAAAEARATLDQQSSGSAAAVALEQQIRLNTLFLGALDSAVMRGSRQELLAQYATAVRPTVSAHLQRAQQLEQLLRTQQLAVRPTRVIPARAALDTPPRPRPAAVVTGVRPRPDTLSRRPEM